MNRYTRSLVIFFTLSIAALGTVAALNVVVDPYTLYDSERRQFVNAVNPDLGLHSFFIKASEIIKDKPDRIILGSSVVDAGFDLNHRRLQFFDELPTTLHSEYARNGVFQNAGVAGGNLWDVFTFLKHAKANNPDLKHAILGLELRMFTDANPPVPRSYLYSHGLMGKRQFTARVLLARTLSWIALRDSLRVLARNNPAAPSTFIGKIRTSLLRSFTGFIGSAWAQSATPERLALSPLPSSMSTSYPVLARSVVESRVLVYSAAVADSARLRIEKGGSGTMGREDAYALLEEIVDFAGENDIRLDIFISPQHWIYWATWDELGLMSHVENWWRRMAGITPYWDLSELIEQSPRVDEFYSSEALHYVPIAGQIILETFLTNNYQGALRVTAENLESVIDAKRGRLAAMLKREPYIADVLKHRRPSRIAQDWNPPAPQDYRPLIKGYNVVRVMERYYALPADQAPYDRRALLQGSCGSLVEAETIDILLDKLDGLGPAPLGDLDCGTGVDPDLADASYAEINRRWPPDGKAIASGEWIAPPENVFDGNPKTEWPSNFFGKDIKGNAWIGYAFEEPRTFVAITLLQSPARSSRQDVVQIQKSMDGGATWTDVGEGLFASGHQRDVFRLPRTAPATHWRLVARGDNATIVEHAWVVSEIQFLEYAGTEFREIFSRSVMEKHQQALR